MKSPIRTLATGAALAALTGFSAGCASSKAVTAAGCERTIVYNRLGSGPPQVLAMTSQGTAVRELATGHAPKWSPDGTLIAFDNGRHIIVMNANGTGQHDITPALR